MSQVVTFGEIMLRLSPPEHLRFAQARSFEAVSYTHLTLPTTPYV